VVCREERPEHDVEAGARSLREPTRSDFSNDVPEAHSFRARCRLRRPEGWQCVEGEAERSLGWQMARHEPPGTLCQTGGLTEPIRPKGARFWYGAPIADGASELSSATLKMV